jgi:hypothetical protein
LEFSQHSNKQVPKQRKPLEPAWMLRCSGLPRGNRNPDPQRRRIDVFYGSQPNLAAQPTDQLQLSILAKALKRQAQRFCNADQHKHGHNTISTLDPTKVGPVNFGFKCQLFLRKTLRQPGAAYSFAKCDE